MIRLLRQDARIVTMNRILYYNHEAQITTKLLQIKFKKLVTFIIITSIQLLIKHFVKIIFI